MKTLLQKTTEQFAIHVKLSPEGMKLFLDVEPVAALELKREEFVATIREAAPKAELHDAVIDDILKCLKLGEKVLERRIAKGTEPQPGANGKLLLLVKKFGSKAEVSVDSKGFAKFSELALFDNVQKGQQVARIYPPKPGVNGVNALGEPIPAATGAPIKVTLDKSLSCSDGPTAEYQLVTSLIDGYLKEDSSGLRISEELVIDGDLDLKVGSINFIGRVKISGDVPPGLVVRGRLGVEIGGAVNEATLISSEGSVVVKGFLRGGEHGKVEAATEFRGTVLQLARVECQGDIHIEKESTESSLRTQKLLRGARSRVVGGEVFVVSGAEAGRWGNEAGTTTIVHLCTDVEARADYTTLMKNIARHEQAQQMIDLHLGPLATNPSRINHLKGEHKIKMEQLVAKRNQIDLSRKKLLVEREALVKDATGAEGVRVNICEQFFPGAQIHLGDKRYNSQEVLKGPKTILYNTTTSDFELVDLQEFAITDNVSKGASNGDKERKK